MNTTKIIFFDIDGTLVDMQTKQISDRTLFALNRLKENGIRICLATGRSPMALPRWEGIDFDAYLTFNGSLCYTDQETVFSSAISREEVKIIIENATLLGRPVAVATKDTLAANGFDDDLAQYYSFSHLTLTESPDFPLISQQKVYQIMMGCKETDYPAILSGTAGVKIAAWWDRAIDIIPANGGKGIGIQKILSHFGLCKADAMAFGDGNNDIEMLQAVGWGIAMGNASASLKAVAAAVCESVNEDGVYQYCLANGLI